LNVFVNYVCLQKDCVGFREVLETYNRITPSIKLHRPTNFAPIIYKAIQIVQQTKKVSTRTIVQCL